MGFFRCMNEKCWDRPEERAGHDFEADVPVCDKCGLDGRDPKFAKFMVKLITVHFDPPSGIVAGVGKNLVLCDGRAVQKLPKGEMASGAPEAVNCKKCRECPEFQAELDPSMRMPDWKFGREIKELTK